MIRVLVSPQEPDLRLEDVAARPAWMPVVSDLRVDRESRSLTCRLQVPVDLPLFGGHFPSAPLVPGVIQVAWAIELARAHGLARGRFKGISAAKFRRMVKPAMCLEARVEQGVHPGQLQFRYECGATLVATGRLQFEPGHD